MLSCCHQQSNQNLPQIPKEEQVVVGPRSWTSSVYIWLRYNTANMVYIWFRGVHDPELHHAGSMVNEYCWVGEDEAGSILACRPPRADLAALNPASTRGHPDSGRGRALGERRRSRGGAERIRRSRSCGDVGGGRGAAWMEDTRSTRRTTATASVAATAPASAAAGECGSDARVCGGRGARQRRPRLRRPRSTRRTTATASVAATAPASAAAGECGSGAGSLGGRGIERGGGRPGRRGVAPAGGEWRRPRWGRRGVRVRVSREHRGGGVREQGSKEGPLNLSGSTAARRTGAAATSSALSTGSLQGKKRGDATFPENPLAVLRALLQTGPAALY